MTAAILNARPAAAPGIVSPTGATADLVRLLGLDRLSFDPGSRPRLVCRWRQDADGRLACIWEPDIGPVSQR